MKLIDRRSKPQRAASRATARPAARRSRDAVPKSAESRLVLVQPVDHGESQSVLRRPAVCAALSAVFNAAILIGLALVAFDPHSAESPPTLYLSLAERTEPKAPVIRPAINKAEPERDSPIASELPAVAEPIPEPVPAGAQAAGEAQAEDPPAARLQPVDDSASDPALTVVATSNSGGDAGASVYDLPGWDDVVFGNGSGQSNRTQFFGIPAFAEQIVYIVDASGSMRGEKFERAKRELLDSVEILGSLQSFAVFMFNDHRHTQVFPDTGGTAPATDELKKELANWIAAIQPRGETHPTKVVRQALGLRPGVVFFLSDGEIPINSVRVAKHDNDGSTTIHTICFQSVAGHDLLQQMATDGGGEYRFVE